MSEQHGGGLHFFVGETDIAAVREARMRWLRPDSNDPNDAVWDGDDDPDTLHLGTTVYDELCGIATVHREPASFNPDLANAWRLRGVATAPLLQRRGVGRIMMMACMQHAWELDGQLVWCNARVEAIPFYQSLGFLIEGDEFDIPKVGPHVVMWRPLDAERETAPPTAD